MTREPAELHAAAVKAAIEQMRADMLAFGVGAIFVGNDGTVRAVSPDEIEHIRDKAAPAMPPDVNRDSG